MADVRCGHVEGRLLVDAKWLLPSGTGDTSNRDGTERPLTPALAGDNVPIGAFAGSVSVRCKLAQADADQRIAIVLRGSDCGTGDA